jgi:hypothetical protein
MKYRILTYADPYRLEENAYWDEIRRYPHLCASKTLVKGMNHLYRNQLESVVCTIDLVVRAFFSDWCNRYETYIRQFVALSGILDQQLADESALYRSAVRQNQADLLAAIRLLKELAIDSTSLSLDHNARKEQKLLRDILKQIEDNQESLFEPSQGSLPDVTDVFLQVADQISRYHDRSPDMEWRQQQQNRLNHIKDTIGKEGVRKLVIHGLHQFKPLMLKLFAHLADNNIEVIFLFNYQHEYRHIYETWLNVYSLFEIEIELNEQTAPCGSGKNLLTSKLAKSLGAFAEGKNLPDIAEDVAVIEFDNMTEYAGYIAGRFADSRRTGKDNPVMNMQEHFYSADSRVNDVLRLYFPEQYGERHFLTVPIGQFFSALYQLWDHQKKIIRYDIDLLREVFSAGVYFNDPTAQLLIVFNRVALFCKGVKTSGEAIARLQSLISNINEINCATQQKIPARQLRQFDFYRLTCEDIEKIISVLQLMETTAKALFDTDPDGALDFGSHYRKINDFLARQASQDLIATQEKKLLAGLQQKLAQAQTLDIKGSYDDLQNSIGYYMKQVAETDDTEFIVNNYDQIEGDIWTSKGQDDQVTYHFGCLSDDQMQRSADSILPWPLSIAFFEQACVNSDNACQIYLTATSEYNAFIRYQLFHGWYFNQRRIKISYVKTTDADESRQPYFFLNLIGARFVRPPERTKDIDRKAVKGQIKEKTEMTYPIEKLYAQNFSLCPYRFFNEILLHQHEQVGFSNEFLCKVYFNQVLLLGKVWHRLSGAPIARYNAEIDAIIDEEIENIEPFFPFWRTYTDLYDAKKKFKRYFEKTCLINENVRNIDEHFLRIKEDFVFNKYTDGKTLENKVGFLLRYEKYAHTRDAVGESLLQYMNSGDAFQTKPFAWCRQCNCDSYCLERIREGDGNH